MLVIMLIVEKHLFPVEKRYPHQHCVEKHNYYFVVVVAAATAGFGAT